MNTKKLGAAGIFLLLLALGVKFYMSQNKPTELKMAFVGHWKSIHPGLQHTLIGDLTLSNQFEALVGFNENGIYVPLASKEWSITPDFKVFKFIIDTNRKFSDGVKLTAHRFKESWENSLKLDPKSSNNSLLDILYKVEGFENFKKIGTLSGVKVIGDDVLEVHFSTPFRMALEHLSGNRFSAFREVNGKFIGTGAYIIEELSPDHLRLTPNSYFPNPAKLPIDLYSVRVSDVVPDLSAGKLDVIAYTMGASISDELEKNSHLSTIVGQDALHRALYPNSQKGRLFEKKEYRQALQYLIYEFLKNDPQFLGNSTYTKFDMQVYLPLQAGRIETNEVEEIIQQGKKHVPALIAATQKKPLVVVETSETSMCEVLAKIGLSVSSQSQVLEKNQVIDMVYKGDGADIITGNFGVASGDPDGIYHKLGKAGAIASPMTNNPPVAELLEDGRKITDKDKLDSFYQNVTRKILEEAPIVHMGFNKAIAVYRNDKIKAEGQILRRNEGHLHIFEAK